MTTNPPRRHERFLMAARLTNGGFPSEKIYRISTVGGQELRHIGFTSYTFDQTKHRHPDQDWAGERDGYVEVIFYELATPTTGIIIPPQCHGCDWSGMVEVPLDSLGAIPRSEWNQHDQYGV